MAKLNIKQLRFVDEYCISHSAADAARKAGYSVKTAYAIGAEVLLRAGLSNRTAHQLFSVPPNAIGQFPIRLFQLMLEQPAWISPRRDFWPQNI
jgi:hypothetical protein